MRSDERGIEFVPGRDWTTAAPGEPCSRCGVRPDVACQHRPASGGLPIAMREEERPKDKRKVERGQGLSFRSRTRP